VARLDPLRAMKQEWLRAAAPFGGERLEHEPAVIAEIHSLEDQPRKPAWAVVRSLSNILT